MGTKKRNGNFVYNEGGRDGRMIGNGMLWPDKMRLSYERFKSQNEEKWKHYYFLGKQLV